MPFAQSAAPLRAVVTGGAGFIGSHIVDALVTRGAHVLAIDDLSTGRMEHLEGALARGAVFECADVRDEQAMAQLVASWRPDAVFHLAAQASVTRSVADPAADEAINLVGTANVLRAARAGSAARFVFTSTGGAIYGEAEVVPTPETAPERPVSPYGMNKLLAEREVGAFTDESMSTVSLRLANVYGPRQDAGGEGGVVAIFSRRLMARDPAVIYGDGTSTRDYIYVGDVVAAALAAAEATSVSDALNIGRGRETSVLELWEALRELAGQPDAEAQHAASRDGEVTRSALDASRAEQELGFKPTRSLHDGLRSTLRWYSERGPGEPT